MDSIDFTQVIIAFGALLLLLGLFWFGARALSGGSRQSKMRPGQRIGVIESAVVDGNRRLVLVRRDDIEHLLLLGGDGDVVIETGIPAPPPRDPSQQKRRATDAPPPDSSGWPTLRVPGREA